MNVGHTSIALSTTQPQSQAAAKSGQLVSPHSPLQSQNNVPNLTSSDQNAADALSAGRINDPLNPSQIHGVDNNPQQLGSDQSGSSRSSNRLDAESAQSEQQDRAQVRQLAKIDREVRDHEAAHAAAGGGLTGAPSYSYTRGPDGQLYATAGEVSINTSKSSDPATSIQNARTLLQAALAPANPSSQDLRVAAQARAQLIDAQAELSRNEEQEAAQVRTSPAVEEAEEQRPADKEASDKEAQQPEPKGSGFQQTQQELQQRQARIQQQQLAFSQEMAELNQRIQQIQQQLIETGQVDPSTLLQGTLVDTQA